MNRRKFLKRIGLGTVGAVVATKVVIEVVPKPQIKPIEKIPPSVAGVGLFEQIRSRGNTYNYQMFASREGQKELEKALNKLNYG